MAIEHNLNFSMWKDAYEIERHIDYNIKGFVGGWRYKEINLSSYPFGKALLVYSATGVNIITEHDLKMIKWLNESNCLKYEFGK